MITSIFARELIEADLFARRAAQAGGTRKVTVDGAARTITYPFPSPEDWRDCWIYFLMLDRFNNPVARPAGPWNMKYGFRQGGTFKGVKDQLGYISDLGARAIWLSPALKNSMPADWEYNYHGYGIQDFLNLDPRFSSDGTLETAEREFAELVDEAHARGIYVILDIVLNHAARVFDYRFDGTTQGDFSSPQIMAAPLGQEPHIEWIDKSGKARQDWTDAIPSGTPLSPDDAVWPSDLQVKEFFRRRGNKLSDTPPPDGFVPGDFGVMRQLVVEYDAAGSQQQALTNTYGRMPVLNILIQAYKFLIAKYDVDGFRIDTVKYVAPDEIQTYGNAMREFALSIGKRNFFTFGEVYDQESVINEFVGRHSSEVEGFGLDAALDFPAFYVLPSAAKGLCGVEAVREVFEKRKKAETGLISSHGEAGKYFVTFLDNHDQKERFNHPASIGEQISLGLTALFCLQGIPCLYYGTEQGLQGTVDAQGNPDLGRDLESVREALWGRPPSGFDRANGLYRQIQTLSRVRMNEPALRYGRIYFRQMSGNGIDFGHSAGAGGVIAFSRVLFDREVLLVANTSTAHRFTGQVLIDLDLNRKPVSMSIEFSNIGTEGTTSTRIVSQARFYNEAGSLTGVGDTAVLDVDLAPMEAQIVAPP
jgi:glycosidase